MKTLKETLAEVKAGFTSQAPPEALALMTRTTQELVATKQHEKALGTGAQFPNFELTDANGQSASSSDILGSGPVIASFFRGFW